MRSTWLLPLFALTLESSAFSQIIGTVRTERFDADQLATLFREQIFPVDEARTRISVSGSAAPETLTLICLAGAEVHHAHDLLEGRLTLKRQGESFEYRDQLGGLWLAEVDPANGTIALRPKAPRGYRFAVNNGESALDMRELVDFKVVQRVLAARPPKRARDFAATHDDLPENIQRTAEQLTGQPKP